MGKPTQPNSVVGVTVIVALIELVLFTATNDGILPTPLAAKPIAVLLLTQVKVAPVTGLLNTIAVVGWFAQTVWFATAFTTPVGCIVIVNVVEVPVQGTPAFVITGVTVMVAVIGADVTLLDTNDAMLPLPLAAKPIDGVLFTQL